MAVHLLCDVHGRRLRLLASESGRHFDGLSVAARTLKLPNRVRKKVILTDNAFACLRHLTEPWADMIFGEVAAALRDPGGAVSWAESDVAPAPVVVPTGERRDSAECHDIHSDVTSEIAEVNFYPAINTISHSEVAIQTECDMSDTVIATGSAPEFEALVQLSMADLAGRTAAAFARLRQVYLEHLTSDSDWLCTDAKRGESLSAVAHNVGGCDDSRHRASRYLEELDPSDTGEVSSARRACLMVRGVFLEFHVQLTVEAYDYLSDETLWQHSMPAQVDFHCGECYGKLIGSLLGNLSMLDSSAEDASVSYDDNPYEILCDQVNRRRRRLFGRSASCGAPPGPSSVWSPYT